MIDYDFQTLNDKEFEALVADVLSAHFGTRVERFKSGPDGGVDGRFFSADGDKIIIQCKHWSKLPPLLNHLDKSEAKKVARLQPARYIFVTSLELSPKDKARIKDIFSPFIHRDNDVFGREDINDLLAKCTDIEKRHYKLWLNSTTVLSSVLDTVVHRGVYENSHALLNEIIEESKCYVHTDNLDKARKKIEEKNSIIITGAPGIGKTTLAKQLCLDYINNEYELCVIKDSIMEASSVYQSDKKQIFYFDDFLGSNCLEALEQRQDSHVVAFIERLRNSKNKKFILTSRTTILEQGKSLTDRFDNARLERNEYQISIDTLSRMEKALILYSHLWHGSLSPEQIDEIYERKRYLEITDHQNYNPRIISFIADSERMSEYSGVSYWANVENILANPKEIWKPVIQNLGDNERHMIMSVCLHGKELPEKKIREVFSKLSGNNIRIDNRQTFESVMRVLTGSLLNRARSQHETTYQLFNPSIADYIYENYLDDAHYLNSLLNCLQTPEALRNLYNLCAPKEAFHVNMPQLLSAVVNLQIDSVHSDNEQMIDDYKLWLGILAIRANKICANTAIVAYLQKVITCVFNKQYNKIEEELMIQFIINCVDNDHIEFDDEKLSNFINELVNVFECDMPEFSLLLELAELTGDSAIMAPFKNRYIDYLKESITDLIIEDGLVESHDDMYSYDEDGEITIDDSDFARDVFNTFIKDTASDMNIDLDEQELAQIHKHIDTYEIEYHLNVQTQHPEAEFTKESERASDNNDDAIIELFERD